MAYPKPIPDNPSKATARATLLAQLSEFKKVFRGVIERGVGDSQARDKIRPIKIAHSRFEGLGIKGKQCAINCRIKTALSPAVIPV